MKGDLPVLDATGSKKYKVVIFAQLPVNVQDYKQAVTEIQRLEVSLKQARSGGVGGF